MSKPYIVYQIDKNTDEIIAEYESAVIAAEAMGRIRPYASTTIKNVCSGTKKEAYGFKWAYKKNYIKKEG